VPTSGLVEQSACKVDSAGLPRPAAPDSISRESLLRSVTIEPLFCFISVSQETLEASVVSRN
jgi:hypothetical protein